MFVTSPRSTMLPSSSSFHTSLFQLNPRSFLLAEVAFDGTPLTVAEAVLRDGIVAANDSDDEQPAAAGPVVLRGAEINWKAVFADIDSDDEQPVEAVVADPVVMDAAEFFAEVLEEGLGEVHGDCCWLLSDSDYIGDFKIVVKLDRGMSVDELVGVTEMLLQKLLSLDGFAAAKFYLSDDLLLVLYMQKGMDNVCVYKFLEGIKLQADFTPYNALVEEATAIWVAKAAIGDSPAIPYSQWIAGISIDEP